MAECCTAAHNLEIVRERLARVEDENRQLRMLVTDLERFQRLVWVLVGDRVNPPERKR